jgi:hypothetical protein
MGKKSNMSLNMIVYIIIGLLVLAIFSYFFYKHVEFTSTSLRTCESKGGNCNSLNEKPCEGKVIKDGKCPINQICCIV